MNETKQLVPYRESHGSLRRLAAAVVAGVLACCAFDAHALTEVVDGVVWTYTVKGGKATVGGGMSSSTAVMSFVSGDLSVPSKLGGCPVTSIDAYAFASCSGLTSVTIPDGVTSIGDYAFFDCRGLTSVTIPEGVTSIGAYAFYGCSGLTSVTIPSSVTSFGQCAFSSCSGLTSVTIPDGVTSIVDFAFNGCSGLTSVTIPDGVTSIGDYAFSGCSALTSVTIPSNVTSIGEDAFSRCSGLTSVTIPSSVTTIGDSAFYNCSGLTSLTISEGVTSIGASAFYGCSGLTSVAIPSSVTSIGDFAFINCSGLTSVTIPSSVTSIGNGAFYGCSGLGDGVVIVDGCVLAVNGTCPASVVLPQGVRLIADRAFFGCSGLTSLTIPSSVTSIGEYAFYGCSGLGDGVVIVDGCVLTVNGTCPASVDLPRGVRLIAASAFYNCTGLTSVTIPEGVTSIGDSAFYGCSGLASATIPEGVTNIGDSAFYNCSGLTSATIPESVTSIGDSVFYNCSKLTGMKIPSSVTSIGESAFYGCSGLTSATIPSGVTSIGAYAFYGCSGLTSVTIPSGVTSIGEYAFYKCSGLSSVTIPEGVTSIGEYAFYGCNGLSSVTIPKGVTSIANYAFYGCYALKSVTIPSGVTSIGEYAFYGCNGLTSVTIPSSVTTIGGHAFYSFAGSKLTSVHISDLVAWCEIDFADDYSNPLAYAHHLYLGDDEITELTIPEGMTSIDASAFYGCSGLKSVTIPEGVTVIGASAFFGCSGLKSVTIPEGVTAIGESAFSGCSCLTAVTIPESVTSIGKDAFSGCSGLGDGVVVVDGCVLAVNGTCPASVDLPCGVRLMADRVFHGCKTLTSLTIPEGVTSIGADAFGYCSGLTSVTIPSGVTVIGESAFNGCSSLESVTIPSSVTSIGEYAFSSCSGLASVTIPEGVTSIANYAFSYCSGLTSVTIPSSVTTIGTAAFIGCGGLASVTISEGVTVIGESAFYGCKGLTSVTIPNSVRTIGVNVFDSCAKLEELTLPFVGGKRGNEGNGQSSLGHLFSYNYHPASLRKVTITDETVIGDGSFYGFSTLTNVTLNAGVWRIGVNAFGNCSGLQAFDVPDGLSEIGSKAFSGCTALAEVKVSSLKKWTEIAFGDSLANPLVACGSGKLFVGSRLVTEVTAEDGITNIGDYAFYGYRDLGLVDVPVGVTNVGTYAFASCSSLTNVVIGDAISRVGAKAFNATPVRDVRIGCREGSVLDDFATCSSLTNLALKGGVRTFSPAKSAGAPGLRLEIDSSNLTIGWAATNLRELVLNGTGTQVQSLYGCTGLKTLTLTGAAVFGSKAVYYYDSKLCNALSRVNVPDIETWLGMTFAEANANPLNLKKLKGPTVDLYVGGERLTDLRVPDSADRIPAWCFCGYEGLTNVVLGNSGTDIGKYAFYGCTALTTISAAPGTPSSGGEAVVDACAFGSCSALTTAAIPGGVASVHKDAFSSCSKLTDVTLPPSLRTLGGLPGSVKAIRISDLGAWLRLDSPANIPAGYALYLNGKLVEDVALPSDLTDLAAGAFSGCASATSLTIPPSLKTIGANAFSGCTGLHRLNLSDLDAWCAVVIESPVLKTGGSYYLNGRPLTDLSAFGNAENVGDYAFYNCTNLVTALLPEGVTNVGSFAFANCTSLERTSVPASTEALGSNVFDGCGKLSVASLAGSYAALGAQLFRNCKALSDVSIPASVTAIAADAFSTCKSIKTVRLSNLAAWCGMTFAKEAQNPVACGARLFLDDEPLTDLVVPNGVTAIGDYVFKNCSGLNSVTIPPSLTSVGTEAFNACNALTSVHIGDLSAWCRVAFADYSANPLNIARHLYLGKDEITELVIPEDVTSIGAYAFYNCIGLKSVTIPEGVTSIGASAFYGCSSLDGLLEIPATVTSIGSSAFRGCKNLREARIHGTWGTAGGYLFYGCSSLTNAVVDGPVTYIPSYSFRETGIRSFVVPEGVTSINSYAFYKCSQMETVTLPEGLETIGSDAFEYTELAKTVTIPLTVRTIGAYALANVKCDFIWQGAPPVIAGTSGASTIPATSTFYVPVNYYLDWLNCGLRNPIIPNDCGSEGPVEISIDAVRPRTPWNGLVDIDVTVSSDVLGDTNSFLLAWSGSGEGISRNIRLEGDADYGSLVSVTSGTHRIVWNAAKDLPGRFETGLKLRVKRFQMSAMKWNVGEVTDVTVDARDMALRYAGKETALRRSPRWVLPGERAAETCTVTCDGETLGTFDAEGELVWRPKSAGVHVLTHAAGGETNVVRMLHPSAEVVVVTNLTIASNETWAADTTYVVVNPLTVPAGVTLTIERGAVVKFFDGASLNVASGGTCLAYGAVFTHVADAAVGVDVVGDGGATPVREGTYSTSGVTTDATTEYRCLAPLLLAANVNANKTLLGYRTYIVSNDVTVASGKTLTLGAGTVLKFAEGKMMTVKGTLKAVGTKGAPAVFTSLKDDSCGGDTNGDGGATVPAPGDWKKISVSSSGKAVFDHALVRYAARGTGTDDAILVNGGSVVFRDSELAFGQMYAIGVESGHFYATNSIVRDFYCAIRHWAKDAFVNCVFHDCNLLANNNGQVLRNCVVTGVTEVWGGVSFDHCVLWNASGVGLQAPPDGFAGANGNLWADPLFLDPENGDFRIARESPCVDAADGRAAPSADHWARPRMNARTVPTGVPDSQGLYADIGVYEVDGRSTQAVCDLAVESVSVSPSAAVIGDSVSVTYEVANVSDVRALGSACDRIAFVADESEGGLLVAAEEVMQAYDLEPGAKVTLKVRVRVPPAKAGNWRVRVTANAERDIFERVTANNSRESSGSVAVEIRTVVAGESATVTVPARGSSAFALTGLGSAGGTVKLDLPPGVKAYAAVGYLPTAGQHDVAGLRIEDGRTALVLPAVAADSEVYVTLVNDGGTEATVVAETEAKAEEVKPSAPADVPVVEHGPAVTMALELPNAVRDGRIYSASVRYANEGDEDAELPIFIVDVKEGDTRLSVCQSGPFTATNVSLVGLAPSAPRGKLKPGESGRVTFYASAMGGLSLRVRRATDKWTCPDPDFADMAEYLQAMSAAATRLCEVGGASDPGFAEVAGMAKAAKNARVSWVSGHLRHAKTGLPLAGAWLTLARTSSVSRAVSCVKTGKDGAFALGTEYPDTYVITAPHMADYESPIFELDGRDVKNVLLKAYPASVVSGSVRTADGEAVSGAGVWLDDLDTEDVGDFKVTTDADGAYSFAEVLDGNYRVLVLPTGSWAMTGGATFTATNGLDYVRDFVLTDTGCPVAGTVTDGVTGEPVTNATVTFTGSSLPASLPVRVDAEGRFAVSALAAGDYEVAVSSEDKRQPHAEPLAVDGVTPVIDFALKVFDKPVFCAARTAGGDPLVTDFRVLETVRNPEWDFDGDGITDSKLARPTHSFSGKGWHAVTLTYDDTNGIRRVCRVPDAVMVIGPVSAELYDDAAYVTIVEPPQEEGGEAVFELPIEDDDGDPEPPKHIVEKGKPPKIWKPKDTKKDDKPPPAGKRRYRARLEEAEIADAFKFYYSEHKITPTKVEWVEPPVVPPAPPPEPPPAVVEPPRDKDWEEVFHGEVDLGRVDKALDGCKLGHTVTVGRETDPNEDRRFHFWVVDKVTNFVYHTSSRYYWRQSTELSLEFHSHTFEPKDKNKPQRCVLLKKRQPGVTLPYGFTVDPEISIGLDRQISVGGKAGIDFGASLDVTYRVLQVDGKLTRDVYDSKVTFDPVQPKIGTTLTGSLDFNVKVQEVLSWMHTLGRVSLGVKGGVVLSAEQYAGVGLDIGGPDGAGIGAHTESSLTFGLELYAALIGSAGWLAEDANAEIELGKFSRLGSAKLGPPEPKWKSDGLTAKFTCEGAKFECDGLLKFMSDWVFPMTACAWTFGDGSKGVGKDVSHTYAHDGVYNAQFYGVCLFPRTLLPLGDDGENGAVQRIPLTVNVMKGRTNQGPDEPRPRPSVPGLEPSRTEDPGNRHLPPNGGPYPPPKGNDPSSGGNSPPQRAVDPNEIVGPAGQGEARLVKTGEWMTYTVYFENKADADVPAQEIRVVDQLPASLDWNTFEMLDVSFGSQVESGLSGRAEGSMTVDQDGSDLDVKIELAFDKTTGRAEWYLRSWDPRRGDYNYWPASDNAGILPPNDETHCGEGYVSYRVKLRDDVPVGSRVDNAATIVFDYNDPIPTDPSWWNTVGKARKIVVSVDGVESEIEVFEGATFGELPDPGTPPEGRSFDGWFTRPGGAGDRITPETVVTPEIDAIYAHWDAPLAYVAEMNGVKYTSLADAVKECPYNASSTNEIKILSDAEWEDRQTYEYVELTDPEVVEAKQNGRWEEYASGSKYVFYKHKIYYFGATPSERVLVVKFRDDDWAFFTGQKVAVDMDGHRHTNAYVQIDCADVTIRDSSLEKAGEVELQAAADLSYGTLTLESGKLVAGSIVRDRATVLVCDTAGRFDFLGGEIVAREDIAAVYVSNGCIRVGGNAVATNAGCNVVLDLDASLELAAPLTGRIGITTDSDVEGMVIGLNPSGFAGAENLYCDNDPSLRGRTMEDGEIVWERVEQLNKSVGRYCKLDLVDDLGIEIPSDVDYAKGDKVTVKVEGLAKGLKLVATPAYEDPTAKKKVIMDYVYTIEGVPTETLDFETQAMYARVSVTYKDKTKTADGTGKAESLQPVALAIVPQEPHVLTAGVINEVYGPVDIAELWPDVADAKANPKDWTFKGWPAGIKYTTKDVTKKNKDKSVTTNAVAYSVYGTPSKAGEFPITATHKYKVGKTTVSETFSAVLTVWGDDGATDFRYTDQAYVATETKTLGATFKNFSGLPTGVKWTTKAVAANEKKGTPAYPAYSLYGTPTKAGVFAVTATKVDPDDPSGKKTVKETFLWKVTSGENDGFLGTMNWPVADSAVTVMAGVIQTNWTCSLPADAKVTASGLPAGLKLAQDKATKAWTLAGTPTKAGNYVVTLKTVRNGVTVTERISVIVTANEWTGNWYGVQSGDDADASLLAEVTVSANGTVKLVYTEASTNYNAKGVVQSAVRKTTVTVKNLDANGTTATLTLPKNKKDPSSEDRVCVLDFEEAALTVNGELRMFLSEADGEAPWPDVTTVVLEETAGGETNAYGYVTATYNAKKGSFALAGKLWDGTSVKGACFALADGVISPVLVTDKAKNAVSITLGSVDGDLLVFVRENGELVPVGRKLPNGYEPWSGSFAAAELKSKKFNMMSGATQLVVLTGRDGEGAVATRVLDVPEKDRKASVSAQGLVKFTVTDADGWKWACELLPVRRGGEGAVATQGGDLQFRGIATGTKKNEPTQACPVWAVD